MKHTKENNMNRIDAIKLLNELKELKQDRTYNKFLIYAITKSVSTSVVLTNSPSFIEYE